MGIYDRSFLTGFAPRIHIMSVYYENIFLTPQQSSQKYVKVTFLGLVFRRLCCPSNILWLCINEKNSAGTNEPANQPINQRNKDPTNQPASQPTSQLTYLPTNNNNNKKEITNESMSEINKGPTIKERIEMDAISLSFLVRWQSVYWQWHA